MVISVVSETGIVVDTTYTAKAVLGMMCEMNTRPGHFRGNRILFIHTGLDLHFHTIYVPATNKLPSSLVTGGMFNLFDGNLDQVVKDTPTSSSIHGYQDS